MESELIMNVTGIIAEYNPFHKGHQYQIDYVRKQLKADYIVVAMSGDYVQRGAPALLPKHLRAKMALNGGADLVLELPVQSSAASAEFFCTGSRFSSGWDRRCNSSVLRKRGRRNFRNALCCPDPK